VPVSIKSQIRRVLSNRATGNVIHWWYNGRVPHRGDYINTDSDRITPKTVADIFWKIYESAEVRFIEKYLDASLDVIEIGGGIGVLSCRICSLLYNRSKLIVLEADPNLSLVIENNVNFNYTKCDCTIINSAVEYRSDGESVKFKKGKTNTTGKILNEGIEEKCIEIPSTSLSAVVRKVSGSYAIVSDIEGSEVGIFLEDRESLSRCEQIIIELHETEYKGDIFKTADIIKNISECGFSLTDKYGPVCYFEKQ